MSPRLAVISILVTLLAAASDAAPKPEQFPRFDGTVIAFELPFHPEYRPHRSITTITADVTMKMGSETLSVPAKTKVEQNVRRSGSKLEWTAEIREMNFFGKPIRSRTPLMTARWLSDNNGSVEGFEMAFPGMKDLGLSGDLEAPKPGTAEYANALRQFGGGLRLPSEPVVTGSILFKQKLVDLFGEAPGLDASKLQQEVGYVVKGWGYYRDRKVLVTEQAFDAPLPMEGEDRASITLAGYTLFDAATFARIRSDILMIMTARTEGKDLLLRIRGTSDATVTER